MFICVEVLLLITFEFCLWVKTRVFSRTRWPKHHVQRLSTVYLKPLWTPSSPKHWISPRPPLFVQPVPEDHRDLTKCAHTNSRKLIMGFFFFILFKFLDRFILQKVKYTVDNILYNLDGYYWKGCKQFKSGRGCLCFFLFELECLQCEVNKQWTVLRTRYIHQLDILK